MVEKPKILIVDDKPSNLIALQTTLDVVDAEFVQANSGNEALKKILHNDFALAIIDVQMPGMDGYELTQFIRSREQSKNLPVIFLSAIYSDDFHVFKGYESGGVDFITKPFEPKILINKIIVFLELYEQKKELQRSAGLYKKTFNAINDIVMLQDDEMRILQINKSGCDILGLPEKDIIGHRCYEIFHGADKPCQNCGYNKNITLNRPNRWEIKHEKINKSFQESAALLENDPGKNILIVHVARDITEQKKLKEQLLQAEKLEAVGTLAGGIAHDFNNILSAILGYTELSQLESDLSPVLRDNLLQIKNAGNRAKELVTQILTFSRKTSKKRIPVLMAPVVKETVKMLSATIPKTVDIRMDIIDSQDRILADPIEIHQVVMNLCMNSFQAMENERGFINISLQLFTVDGNKSRRATDLQPGNYLQLLVEDNGRGMDANLQRQIFDPFFTTKEKGQGTGMGLAVVHGIINECGGTISVRSKVGDGTLFELLFPIVNEIAPDESTVAVLPAKGTGTILFVDDEEPLLEVGRRYLEFLGYNVITASSSHEALMIFKEMASDFHCVITDQTMPGLPGNLLARELMRIRTDIPVILCTGHSSIISEEEALQANIKAYLIKPIALIALADTLSKVLKESITS